MHWKYPPYFFVIDTPLMIDDKSISCLSKTLASDPLLSSRSFSAFSTRWSSSAASPATSSSASPWPGASSSTTSPTSSSWTSHSQVRTYRAGRITKQQPSRAKSSNQVGCCLVSVNFWFDILNTIEGHCHLIIYHLRADPLGCRRAKVDEYVQRRK